MPSIIRGSDNFDSAGSGPAGVAFDFYGSTAPAGSFACNGQELVQATYPELYAAIGDLWATTGGVAAPAAGNFRLPPQQVGDLGLYNRGVGVTNGVVGTYQEDVFKSHNHAMTGITDDSNTVGGADKLSNNSSSYIQNTSSTGDATETRPRSITVLKCIWTGE